MKKIIVVLGLLILLTVSVMSFTINQITAPTSYSTSATTSINISGGINITNFPYLQIVNQSFSNFSTHVINVTILNKSCSSCAYGILASSLSLTVNATNISGNTNNFWNFTATFKEGRNWIRLNFTNVSRADDVSFGGSLTDEVIVDIDTTKYKLIVGGKSGFLKLNLSTDTGLIQTDYGLQTGGAATASCGATTRGLIIYNSTQGFIGCTDAGWKALNGTLV